MGGCVCTLWHCGLFLFSMNPLFATCCYLQNKQGWHKRQSFSLLSHRSEAMERPPDSLKKLLSHQPILHITSHYWQSLAHNSMIQFLFILFTDYSVQIFAARHPINGFLHCKNHWYDNIIRTLQKGLAHWKVNNERVLLHEKSWQLTKHTASTRLAFYVSRLNCRQECFVI